METIAQADSLEATLEAAQDLAKRLESGLSQVVLGKSEVLKRLLCAVVAGGHVLFEDVPGVGKTTAAKALARLLMRDHQPIEFRRIQFTPDLLPYDITGVDVFHPETKSFEFKPGPIFAQVVLGDEINRATPKVQSAMLEVMEEGHVTVGGTTRNMDPFFLVVATQNPIEMEGTYPLPAAQLDRFLFKLSMGYPALEAETAVWLGDPAHHALYGVTPVATTSEIIAVRNQLPKIHVAPTLLEVIARLIRNTRSHPSIELGLSPRSGVHLIRALRAWALIQGRPYIIDQDLKDLAVDVLAHRIILREEKRSSRELLETLLEEELKLHEA